MSEKSALFTEAVSRGEEGEISNFESWMEDHDISSSKYEELQEVLQEQTGRTVNFEDAIEILGEYVGSLQSSKKERHIAIKGVDGIGKTQLSLLMKELIQEHRKNVSCFYFASEDYEDGEKFSRIMSQLQDEDNEKVIFLDDAWEDKRIDHVLNKIRELNKHLLVSMWTPERFRLNEVRIDSAYPVSQEIELTPLNKEDTRHLVTEIANIVCLEDDCSIKVSFADEVYEFGQGIPRLTLILFKESVRKSFLEGRDLFETESVEDVAAKLGILGVEEKLQSLTEFKTKVLEKIIVSEDPRGLSPSQLAKDVKKDKSTISYHLRDLKKKNLVEKKGYGRKTFYTAKGSVKPIVQLHLQGENQFYD